MEGHISPVSSAGEEDEAEIAAILQEELQFDEVDINIHFHCEHCFKVECRVWPKPGWSCEVLACPHYCGMRFHACKLPEHLLLCSHTRVPCLNASYGCPHTLPRYTLASHLPRCPASVVVCSCERNRWLSGTRLREAVTPHRGHMRNYSPHDLDVSLALHDQALLNQLSGLAPHQLHTTTTNRRYPALPLHSPLTGGVYRPHLPSSSYGGGRSKRSPSLATDEEDLVPGLSGSVCAKLKLPGRCNKDGAPTATSTAAPDDYYLHVCSHGVHRTMCRMCRHDAPPANVQLKSVWREEWVSSTDGGLSPRWVKQQRVAKVRRRGPLDTVVFCRVEESDEEAAGEGGDPEGTPSLRSVSAPLTPAELRLELSFENYSKHQTKPRNMITIQCLQVLRRDEYPHHYWGVHCGLLGEGLEGGQLLRRCPLHALGCSYSQLHLTAGAQKGEVSFSPLMQAFGLKPHLDYEPSLPPDTRAGSQERSKDASPTAVPSTSAASSFLILPTPLSLCPNPPSPSPASSLRPSPSPTLSYFPILYQAAPRLTCLPQEILLHILSFLDGFSLSQVSLTCEVLASACSALVRDRGLVLMYWYRADLDQNDRGDFDHVPSEDLAQGSSVVSARGGDTHALPSASTEASTAECDADDDEEGAVGGDRRQGAGGGSRKKVRTRWKLSKPRWVFSSSFGAIDGWRVKEGVPSVAQHLLTCSYYHRNVPAAKFSYGALPKRGPPRLPLAVLRG